MDGHINNQSTSDDDYVFLNTTPTAQSQKDDEDGSVKYAQTKSQSTHSQTSIPYHQSILAKPFGFQISTQYPVSQSTEGE
jgi:hypothetical protein